MGTVTAAVGLRDVRASTRDLVPLAEPDYVDEFTLTLDAPSDAPADAWARAMFGDAPDAAQRCIFRGLLRLRLAAPPTSETVAGFVVAARTTTWIRLEASSPFLTCHLVVRTDRTTVALATFMRYTGRAGTLLWTPTSAIHRRLAPGLLRDAAGEGH